VISTAGIYNFGVPGRGSSLWVDQCTGGLTSRYTGKRFPVGLLRANARYSARRQVAKWVAISTSPRPTSASLRLIALPCGDYRLPTSCGQRPPTNEHTQRSMFALLRLEKDVNPRIEKDFTMTRDEQHSRTLSPQRTTPAIARTGHRQSWRPDLVLRPEEARAKLIMAGCAQPLAFLSPTISTGHMGFEKSAAHHDGHHRGRRVASHAPAIRMRDFLLYSEGFACNIPRQVGVNGSTVGGWRHSIYGAPDRVTQ